MKKIFIIIPVVILSVLVLKAVVGPKSKPPGPLLTVPLSTKTLSTKTTRSYYMGFSLLLPPTSKPDEVIPKKIDLIAQNADALIEHPDVPWKALLAGESPEKLAENLLLSAINKARSKKLKIFITLEPLDGVNRAEEAPELRKLKRSIVEPAVQDAFKRFAQAVVKVAKPDYLGLAAEVNLYRRLGAETIYQALVKMVNDTAAEIGKTNPNLPWYVSVNNEVAWGIAEQKHYQGIEYVFKDFASMDMLAMTIYPISLYDSPDQIPADYLSRLLAGRKIPVVIDESGWPSQFKKKATSPKMQAQWIRKLALLADSVDTRLVGQLLLLDVEPAFSNKDVEVFTTQGLYTYDFQAKPALAEWQTIFKRSFSP